MRRLDGKWIGPLGLTLVFGLAVVGCGDDDSGTNDAGPDGGIHRRRRRRDGRRQEGRRQRRQHDRHRRPHDDWRHRRHRASRWPMCDTTVTAETSCGDNTCAASTSMLASFVCSVPCCLPDNSCGFRRTNTGAVTDCAPVGVRRSQLPRHGCDGMGPGGGTGGMSTADAGDGGAVMVRPGCCATSGHCGVISTIDGSASRRARSSWT